MMHTGRCGTQPYVLLEQLLDGVGEWRQTRTAASGADAGAVAVRTFRLRGIELGVDTGAVALGAPAVALEPASVTIRTASASHGSECSRWSGPRMRELGPWRAHSCVPCRDSSRHFSAYSEKRPH